MEAKFDDYTVITDQPIRYKDASLPVDPLYLPATEHTASQLGPGAIINTARPAAISISASPNEPIKNEPWNVLMREYKLAAGPWPPNTSPVY
ncbi:MULTISPECIES: hypothetical protein [unclassified Alcanivorax]|uniref:hypothetical protein n=1 Tax=unclassified Alcanivorax TaxID=2638842 RepID=UPI0012DCBE65|nr:MULTISPECIES: hypothetical protein [unclassified Alcanivorax]